VTIFFVMHLGPHGPTMRKGRGYAGSSRNAVATASGSLNIA